MQSIAPTTAGHLSSGVLVHDDNLVFLNYVIDIFFKQTISPEELGDIVNPFRLAVTMLLALLFGFVFLGIIQTRVQINIGELRDQIRQDESIRVVRIQEG